MRKRDLENGKWNLTKLRSIYEHIGCGKDVYSACEEESVDPLYFEQFCKGDLKVDDSRFCAKRYTKGSKERTKDNWASEMLSAVLGNALNYASDGDEIETICNYLLDGDWLTEKDRACITYYYKNRLNTKEIGELLELDKEGIRYHIGKALRRLNNPLILTEALKEVSDRDEKVSQLKESLRAIIDERDKAYQNFDELYQRHRDSEIAELEQQIEDVRKDLARCEDQTERIASREGRWGNNEYKDRYSRINDVRVEVYRLMEELNLNRKSMGYLVADKVNLHDVDLTMRVLNALTRNGLETLGDVRKLYEEEGEKGLMKIRNLGEQSVHDIVKMLKETYGDQLYEKRDES